MRKSSAISAAIILAITAFGWWWIVEDPCRPSNSEVAKNFAEVIVFMIGGCWACYRFLLQRESDPAIGIKLTCKHIPNGNKCCLTYFDVTLTNKGKVKVEARKERNPAYPVETKDHPDKEETLKYGCSLLLRAIPRDLPERTVIDWFDEKTSMKSSPLIEADLIYDYEIEGETSFWMEPAESYHVGVGVVLPPGVYLAMVTFIGNKNDDEFWRRKFIVEIPEQNPVAKN